MIAGSIVLALTLIAFAVWLQWNEVLGEESRSNEGLHNQSKLTELDERYFHKRTRARKWIHALIAGCGVAIIITAFAGNAIVWMVGWILVMLVLMVVMLMAALDALRTYHYHQRKLPEVRRQVMGEK